MEALKFLVVGGAQAVMSMMSYSALDQPIVITDAGLFWALSDLVPMADFLFWRKGPRQQDRFLMVKFLSFGIDSL